MRAERERNGGFSSCVCVETQSSLHAEKSAAAGNSSGFYVVTWPDARKRPREVLLSNTSEFRALVAEAVSHN